MGSLGRICSVSNCLVIGPHVVYDRILAAVQKDSRDGLGPLCLDESSVSSDPHAA